MRFNRLPLGAGATKSFRTTGQAAVAVHRFSTSSCDAAASTLQSLRDKVELRTGPLGRLSKILSPRTSTTITTRVGSSFTGNHSLEWVQRPRNILIVKKRNNAPARAAAVRIAEYIAKEYPDITLIAETEAHAELREQIPDLVLAKQEDRRTLSRKVDFVITLGGDGTILHASSLFDDAPVPPVLSFSMGTLGFLLPFHIDAFETALTELLSSRSSLLFRMRLELTTHEADGTPLATADGRSGGIHLMNEVALHRGREPHLTVIDAFVEGRHLTQAISDGLIISTPTGSTAYSLSAGGPIVHPSVQSLVLTPICPRSLSFRTVLLPSDSAIQLKIDRRSRASAELTVDGRDLGLLAPGQFLQVAMSPYPIPCVNRSSHQGGAAVSSRPGEPKLLELNEGKTGEADSIVGRSERGEDDWVRDINTLLKFNASFGRDLLDGPDGEKTG